MNMSQPVDWLRKPLIGYMINAEFSKQNASTLMGIIREIEALCGDAAFCMPVGSLHITLLDWIAPLVNYGGQDKDALYKSVSAEYDEVITNILASVGPIEVHFNEIKVSPSTIFVAGHDDGTFQNIREQFVKSVELLPDTKLPPTIIHSSLARFTKQIDLAGTESFINRKTIDFNQKITNFRLVRSTKEPLLEFETIKRYELK